MHRFRSPSRSSTGLSVKKETISAPIPIPDDDEFPIRTPGASIATPVGDERRISFHEPSSPRRSLAEVIMGEPSKDRIASPLGQQFEQPTPAQAENSNAQRVSLNSVRTPSSVAKPERKKSTLKHMLGKLFGRKRKGSDPTHSKRNSSKPVSQHRSDPIVLSRPPITKNYSSQRSVSLPINEFNRALRSHSVVLEDFPLRASYQPQQDSLKPEGSITRPRGATTPSRSFDMIKTPLYGDWTGLSPRPASSHARGSKGCSSTDLREVGVAVTSDTHQNRRSRSLGELRAMSQDFTVRRRSDEIKYWRQSQEQGLLSPISSMKPDDEHVVIDEAEVYSQKENYEPPQPFNFGPHLTEMAGMKITQAASLETRVTQLEHRMLNLEHCVPQAQRSTSARPTTAASEVSIPKHIHRASPQRPIRASQGRDGRAFSFVSSHPSVNTNNNISNQPSFESYVAPVNPPLGTFHHNAPRPLSTSTTIRAGPPGSSPTTKDGTLTTEHYATLVSMITTEQAARHNLEDLVHDLQQELNTLRASLPTNGYNYQEYSHMSHTSSDRGDENEPLYADEEVFKTPMETNAEFGEGIFGEVSGNRGAGYDRQKTAPRTLSLGQITQNGPQKIVSTNF